MTAHTPGPWKVEFNAPTAAIPGHIIRTDDDVRHPIASLWVGGGTKGKPTQVANANLIAAAPDLLETLQAIANAKPREWDEEVRGQFRAWAQSIARNAIAKATGGAP